MNLTQLMMAPPENVERLARWLEVPVVVCVADGPCACGVCGDLLAGRILSAAYVPDPRVERRRRKDGRARVRR